MVLSSLFLAAAMIQQGTVQAKETLLDPTMLSGSISGSHAAAIGSPLTFRVLVRDMDLYAYYNPTTEAVRSVVRYSDQQNILADPQVHAGSKGEGFQLVRQDQMTVERVGWDEKKEWYEYKVTVVLDKEQQVVGKYYKLAIGIHDTTRADWLRDKPLYLAKGFILK